MGCFKHGGSGARAGRLVAAALAGACFALLSTTRSCPVRAAPAPGDPGAASPADGAAPLTSAPGAARPAQPLLPCATDAHVGSDPMVEVDLGGLSGAEARWLARLVPDREEAVVARARRLALPRRQLDGLEALGLRLSEVGPVPAQAPGWPSCYRTLEETYLWAGAFAERHGWLVEVLDIGDSYCKQAGGCVTPGRDRIAGSDLLVLRIANRLSTAPRTARLFVDGGLHAREIPGPEVVMAFAERLVGAYGVDAQVTYLLDHGEAYLGLNSNPDGRALVELGLEGRYGSRPWSWRKNGHEPRGSNCAWPPFDGDHFGVDLNRNHAFKWSLPGGTRDPCDQTYVGASAASEPETQAYEAFARSIFDDARGPDDRDPAKRDARGVVVNLHNATSPGTVLLPWGWTERPAPDAPELEAIAARYAGLAGNYVWSTALYRVSGNTRDWAYGELGVPAYVIELEGLAFFTPCDDLRSVVDGQMAPLLMALGLSDRPYERVRGPEVTEVQAPDAIVRGEPLRVVARLDARELAPGAIGAAEVAIGAPGGMSAGPGLPAPSVGPGHGIAAMPDDGAFDEPAEWVTAEVGTAAIEPGWYYVLVRGRGADGSWGPGRALFVSIVAPTVTPTATPRPVPTATPEPTRMVTASVTPTTDGPPTAAASATGPATVVPSATASGLDGPWRAALPWLTR